MNASRVRNNNVHIVCTIALFGLLALLLIKAVKTLPEPPAPESVTAVTPAEIDEKIVTCIDGYIEQYRKDSDAGALHAGIKTCIEQE